MRKPTGRVLLAAVAAAIAAAMTVPRAVAADDEPAAERFELTPFGGYRLGGEFEIAGTDGRAHVLDRASFAVAFDVRADEDSHYELLFSRQATLVEPGSSFAGAHLDVDYLHVGGIVTLDERKYLTSYMAGGLGATRLTLDVPGTAEETRFSMSLALGLRVPLRRHLDLRLEARGYGTLVDSHGSIFCRSDESGGACVLHGTGSVLLQFELLAGLAVKF